MSNIELIKSFGFIEKDGWLCNPKLDNEAIFQINENLEKRDVKWIIEVITSTAFNAGSRYAKENYRNRVVKHLEELIVETKYKLF